MDMFILDQPHMAYTEQTSTSSVYLQDFRSEPCQVCGENASGWHCGSITWLVDLNRSMIEVKFIFLVKHVKNFFFDQ